MNEIEKLYSLAGCKKIFCDCTKCKKTDCISKYIDQDTCVTLTYSPFTTEKQIELIKWLAIHKSSYGLQYFGKQWCNCCEFEWENFEQCSEDADFEQSLAGLINIIWQDLTEEERKQIKEILE